MSADVVVAHARSWIGTPYRHQASLKGVGCDCLGLLRGVWRDVFGVEPELPPPYTPDWAESGADTLVAAARRYLVEIDARDVAAGDVLLFRWRHGLPAKHCAITASPASMIHAHDGACVTEVAIGPWWRRHLSHAFRFPEI
ncbi:NlpC/P60 family protein [Microvirga flavescens]|uniref:NlpC/P60 family protein n=1 Tax=Microvirga flavescens TaxID=2249811 RepID=UPI000DD725F8|nr:NlpC/P60 family protein [Microvirga flavescens]